MPAHLGRAEGEGRRLDVGFLFVHEEKVLVFQETQVLARGDVPQSERLAPPYVAPTPPADTGQTPSNSSRSHSHRETASDVCQP